MAFFAKVKEYDMDIISLSGLFTSSLYAMVDYAKEMVKRGLTWPLISGGTTSKVYTVHGKEYHGIGGSQTE